MSEEEEVGKTRALQAALNSAINEALGDAGDEVLVNKWVFIADLLIDGERTLLPVWEEEMDPIDVEAVIAPVYRLAKDITNTTVLGMDSSVLDMLSRHDDDDEDEDDDLYDE